MNNLKDLISNNNDFFKLTTSEATLENTYSDIYATDLLSVAMSNAKANSILITVINNLNTIAVSSLLDLPCVILTNSVKPSIEMINKANEEQIAVFTTKFDTVTVIRKLDNLNNI